MKILYLTTSAIDDFSYGGALRGNYIRAALLRCGAVDTIVIHGGIKFRIDDKWSRDRVKTAVFTRKPSFFYKSVETKTLIDWLEKILVHEDYDVIVVRYIGLSQLVKQKYWRKVIVDADDLIKHSPKSVLGKVKYFVRNIIATQVIRRFGYVWLVNHNDEKFVFTERKCFLPNVIDTNKIKRSRRAVQSTKIIMVGYLYHQPNMEGLLWFIRNVFPALKKIYPDLSLQVIGKYPKQVENEKFEGVVFRGYVESISAEYDEAAIVIAPIIGGAGTQIKVLDALAHDRPLVVAPFAFSGFSNVLKADEHLLLAHNKDDWINKCCWILNNQVDAETMAWRGGEVIRSVYSLESMYKIVEMTIKGFGVGSASNDQYSKEGQMRLP